MLLGHKEEDERWGVLWAGRRGQLAFGVLKTRDEKEKNFEQGEPNLKRRRTPFPKNTNPWTN